MINFQIIFITLILVQQIQIKLYQGRLCSSLHLHIIYRIVEMYSKRGVIEIRNPKGGPTDSPRTFTFDKVYDWK